MVRKKREFLISLLVLLAGWNALTSYFNYNPGNITKRDYYENLDMKSRESNKQLKILSYNVRAFNLYNWMENPDTRNKIFEFIQREDPDIICLQEYYSSERGDFTTKDIIRILSNTPYRHIQHTIGENSFRHYGIATFSKYPIVGQGNLSFNKTINITIYTDVKKGNDTIRVYNNHLQSISLKRNSYSFLDSLKLRYDEQHLEEIRDISSRLKYAYIKRADQAERISGHIASSPYPVIVAGDFNDTPVSYTYQKISKGLKDSFVEAGWGTGSTYNGRFPSFRIDYILHSKEMNTIYYIRKKMPLSDHFPVISFIETE